MLEKRQIQAFYGDTMERAVALALPTILEKLLVLAQPIRIGTCAGSTVKQFFKALVLERTASAQWQDVLQRSVFLPGDERVVEATSPACNLRALNEQLFSPLELKPEQIAWYRYDPDAEDLGLADLNRTFRVHGSAIDVNICALGPREAGFGHFYSVFGEVLDEIWEAKEYVAVEQGEKEPRRRVTLPPKVVLASPVNLVFVSKGREDVLRAFLEDADTFTDCPGRMLRYCLGHSGITPRRAPVTILMSDCETG
jgi:6-phosphogluconolactonase/glucosamine-6-phosphate isomerase/deaminase